MNFPLSIFDIGLWLAVTAIILLITSEFLSSQTAFLGDIIIERDRLRLVALGFGVAFMFIVLIQAFDLF